MTIRACTVADAARVSEIYDHYVRTSVATFEVEPVGAEEMARRIGHVTARYPWLVSEQDGRVAGYAYASAWKARYAYRFTVETTIYLAPEQLRRGIGRPLYSALLDELRTRDLHRAVACIALPHPASVALHEQLGFERIGVFSEVGYKLDRWVDVGYWQLTF